MTGGVNFGNWLYPRLDSMRAERLFGEYKNLSLEELEALSATEHAEAAPGMSGGLPVAVEMLDQIRNDLRAMCVEFGYPSPLSNSTQAEFDRCCGTYLYHHMQIIPGDAAEQGVWAFLTLVLVPELAPWRFPSRSRNRILGHRRNALRRLWQRAHVLGPDLTAVPPNLTPLGEDDYFQIMERSTVSNSSRLARTVRDSMWRFEMAYPEVNRNRALRVAIILIRAERTHISIHALSDEQLTSRVDLLFSQARIRISENKVC